MLVMALRMGSTSQGSDTFICSVHPNGGEEDRRGESSQGQRGESSVIWVILVTVGNVSLSPIALLTGWDIKWSIGIELRLVQVFSCHLGMIPIFGNEKKICYWERSSELPLVFIFPMSVKCRPPCLFWMCQHSSDIFICSFCSDGCCHIE